MAEKRRGVHFPSFKFDPDTYDREHTPLRDEGEFEAAKVHYMLEGYKEACPVDAPVQRMSVSDMAIQMMASSLLDYLHDLCGPDIYQAWLNTMDVDRSIRGAGGFPPPPG